MSQVMPDGDFEWLSEDECNDQRLRIYYANGRIAIFDSGLFDYLENEVDTISFILDVDLEYPPELHESEDDYHLALEVMTIEPEITGEKQRNLLAQHFGTACPYSRKLICSFLPKKHYVGLGKLFHSYIDSGMRLAKVHRAIQFKSSPYVVSCIANKSAKR